MEIHPLARELASFLTPLLPHLARLGEEDAELAGAQLAGDRWEDAKALWRRLRPQMMEHQAAAAAGEVAARPESPAAGDALAAQIDGLLRNDPDLASQVELRFLDPTRVTSGDVVVTANNTHDALAVAAGPGVSEEEVAVIAPGDRAR
ncbi:MAG TPA: hypothetical protein VEL74_08435 [Thermoanaerobaculia bacterium]|nr:hypothetical protein [Thermoanaerobaculia bacterium]